MKYGVTISTMATEKRPATFGDGNAAGHFAGIRKLGFNGVDVFIKPMPDAELDRFQAGLEESGLEVSVIFPIIVFESGLVLSDPDIDSRKKAVALYKNQIDLAKTLGSGIVLGLERGNILEGEDPAAYQDRLAPGLSEIADYAEKRGVAVSMEPIHRFLVNSFNRVEECLEFFEKYHLDTVRLLLDTFHMNIEERSIENAVMLAGSRIGHVHTVDNNRGAPGDGHVDFVSFIGALKREGYDGYLSVETVPEKKPYDTASRGISFLRSIVEPNSYGERL
jgi:5-keto-L-gluconate epimerase